MISAAADLRPVLTDPVASRLPGTTPEFELLLDCCAKRLASSLSKCTWSFDPQQHDWKFFITLAEHHGVTPLVYHSLTPHFDRLPLPDSALLREKYEENARKTLWLTGELIRAQRHLEVCGIKAMPYKGAVLAQTLYGAVTERQFGDIDILVRPEDVGAAKDALATAGYRPTIRLNPRQERAFIQAGYECPFDGPAGAHLVELHWRILPRFYSVDFDMAGLFEKAEWSTMHGCSIPTLCPDDLLLVLCVHAAKHVWAQLSWLCDIAELARSQPIDWDAVWQRASSLGIRRIVILNLLLAHDLFGSVLPIPIQQWLETDRTCQILKVEILRIITLGLPYDTESLAYFRLMIRLRERISDKARFLWRLIWSPGIGEWSAVQVPEWFFPLYHFVRLGRLAKRIGGLFATGTVRL